ncbi:MAG: tyrosine-type recombinase/integrase [Candidatus Methanoperedens sp.]|nr:tyrosine-type recombinase/integrase [Candidatus Methanoperedens sp.]
MLYENFLKIAKAKGRATNSMKSYQQVIGGAQAWINKPLENATTDDLMRFIEYKKGQGLNQTSIWIFEKKLIQFFNFCFNETEDVKFTKIIRKLKTVKVDTPKNDIKPQDILLPEDIKRLINVSTIERDRCLISILYESGMRVGELRALTTDMIEMNEEKQEVTFHIPDQEGCKTGTRSVLCLEVFSYVQDWMKCNVNQKFMPLSQSGINKILQVLFKKAGINKPSNPHMMRHSSITNAVIMKMQPNQISMRYWGQPNSSQLSVYLHLSEQIVNSGYRDAKGMGNGNGNTVINPLASRCVNCGKLIQSGNLCKTCDDNKTMKAKIAELEGQRKSDMAAMEAKINEIIRAAVGKGVFDIPGRKESIVDKEIAGLKKQFDIKT